MIPTRIILAICAALAVLPAHTQAQGDIPQTEIKFYVQTASAQPVYCGIEFWHLYRDFHYGGGSPSLVTGSLAWSESSGNVGLNLKVVGAEVPLTAPAGTPPQFFSIAQAFLMESGRAHFVAKSFKCERKSAFCGVYGLSSTVSLLKAAEGGELSLKFNRLDGGLDNSVPLDTRSAATTSPADHFKFANCVLAIFDRARAKLQQ